MTLLHRITLRISVVVAVLLTGWAFLFYFAITDEINDETDDSLEHYAEILIERALAGESLPATTNGSNNQYYLERISEEMAQVTPGICYGDTMIYIWDKKETEPARFYSAIFRDDDGQYYNLRVFTPTFEKEDLIQSILLLIIILYSALLIAIIVVNMIVFYRSMKPFYRVIRWLDAYRPGGRTSELKNDTNISEFRKLNEAAVNYTKRMEELFDKQKEFIGNASHEIQTPLAICRNRIEMMLEQENLTVEQAEQLASVYSTLQRISKLNKTLLLLSRIDNRQFPNQKPIDFNELIKRFLPDFEEIFAHKQIHVKVIEKGVFLKTMNETLAEILMSNLLRNAFIHTPQGERLEIRLSEQGFSIRNSGAKPIPDPDKIFERFYQGSKKNGTSGLGLAIVDAICRNEKLKIAYRYDGTFHVFTIENAD